jgi:hypothetical protein
VPQVVQPDVLETQAVAHSDKEPRHIVGTDGHSPST